MFLLSLVSQPAILPQQATRKKSTVTCNRLFLFMKFRSGSKTKKIFSLNLAYHIFYLHYSKNATNFNLQHLPHLLKILRLNSLCIFTISQRLAILLHAYRRLLYLCIEQLLQRLLQTSSLIAFSIFFYTVWQPSQIHLVAVKPFCLALQILLCDPT